METRNAYRAQSLEDQKAEIDEQIDLFRGLRDNAPTEELAEKWDKAIDELLIQKDNLTPREVVAFDALGGAAEIVDEFSEEEVSKRWEETSEEYKKSLPLVNYHHPVVPF